MPHTFYEYDTAMITDIILDSTDNLFSSNPDNYTNLLSTHIFNSSLDNAYEYAAASFLAGI